MKKRVRSVNFKIQETERLVSLIESKIDIIESRQCDSVTWQEKEKAWKYIEKEFNRLHLKGEVYRDAKCLRFKYEALKRDTRRKERIIQSQRYNIGSYCGENINTTQQYTRLEKRIRDMIVPLVERTASISDSDQADVKDFIIEYPPIDSIEDKPAEDEPLRKDEIECENDDEKAFQEQIENDSNDSEAAKSSSTIWKNEIRSTRIEYPSAIKPKTHSVLNKSKLKKRRLADDMLAAAKLENAILQKRLFTQEIEKELVQTRIFEEELEHRRQIQELEKQHMLLKIQLTKTEIENTVTQDKSCIK